MFSSNNTSSYYQSLRKMYGGEEEDMYIRTSQFIRCIVHHCYLHYVASPLQEVSRIYWCLNIQYLIYTGRALGASLRGMEVMRYRCKPTIQNRLESLIPWCTSDNVWNWGTAPLYFYCLLILLTLPRGFVISHLLGGNL